MDNYTVESLSELLKNMGYNVSPRTIKYYAYEKNMLSNLKPGKKSFTKTELDDIIKIQKLKNCTSLKLDEIKEIIKDKNIQEVNDYIAGRYYKSCFDEKSAISNTMFSVANDNSMSFNSSLSCKDSNENFIKRSFSGDNQAFHGGYIGDKIVNPLDQYNINNKMPVINSCENKESVSKRTIKVTDDITLTITENIDTKKLKEIINFIKNL